MLIPIKWMASEWHYTCQFVMAPTVDFLDHTHLQRIKGERSQDRATALKIKSVQIKEVGRSISNLSKHEIQPFVFSSSSIGYVSIVGLCSWIEIGYQVVFPGGTIRVLGRISLCEARLLCSSQGVQNPSALPTKCHQDSPLTVTTQNARPGTLHLRKPLFLTENHGMQ